MLPHGLEVQLLGNLSCCHTAFDVLATNKLCILFIILFTLFMFRPHLFVGEHEDVGLAELLVAEHFVEFLFGDAQAVAIGRVHHQDDKLRGSNVERLSHYSCSTHLPPVSVRTYLCVRVVCVPRGPERLLAAQVPHDEVDVLPHHLFHVGPDGGRRVDNFVHQELVENCRLARVVQAHDADLVLWRGGEQVHFH